MRYGEVSEHVKTAKLVKSLKIQMQAHKVGQMNAIQQRLNSSSEQDLQELGKIAIIRNHRIQIGSTQYQKYEVDTWNVK